MIEKNKQTDISDTLGYALRFILSLAALMKGTRLNNGFAIFKNGC